MTTTTTMSLFLNFIVMCFIYTAPKRVVTGKCGRCRRLRWFFFVFLHRLEIFFSGIEETKKKIAQKENLASNVRNSYYEFQMFQRLCMKRALNTVYLIVFILVTIFMLRVSVCIGANQRHWVHAVCKFIDTHTHGSNDIYLYLLNYIESANSETGENKWMLWFCGTDETCNENLERNHFHHRFLFCSEMWVREWSK